MTDMTPEEFELPPQGDMHWIYETLVRCSQGKAEIQRALPRMIQEARAHVVWTGAAQTKINGLRDALEVARKNQRKKPGPKPKTPPLSNEGEA